MRHFATALVITLCAISAHAEQPLIQLFAGFFDPPWFTAEWTPPSGDTGHWIHARVPLEHMTAIQVAPNDGVEHWVSFVGQLIITTGQSSAACNVLAWIRHPGEGNSDVQGYDLPGITPFQAINEARTNFSSTVKTDSQGQVEIGWSLKTTAGEPAQIPWPLGCAYMVRIAVQRVE